MEQLVIQESLQDQILIDMAPFMNNHRISSLNETMHINTRHDEAIGMKQDVATPTTSNSTDASMSQQSPHDIQSMQLGPSASYDSLKIMHLGTSISIGSPRSVFAVVPKSPQHTSMERNHNLLPPSASTNQNNGKLGGVLDKWKNKEESDQKAIDLKSKPVEYRFKPIVNNNEKDLYPDKQKIVLSSRARKRKNVPFTHIIIRDDDSCTTVSTLSFDPSEFDVDVLQSFAEKYQNTNIEAHKELLRETNELIARLSKHNLGATEDIEKVTGEQLELNNTVVDADQLMDDTNKLLDQFDEELPPDIAALVEEDELHLSQLNEEKRRPLSILDEMDHDLALQVEEPKTLPPHIEALVEDNDLSFDDLRDDDDNQEIEPENIRNTADVVSLKESSLLEKGASDNFFSDDEGLSFSKYDDSLHNADKASTQILGLEENDQVQTENSNIRLKVPQIVETAENGMENLVHLLNPRMHEKANGMNQGRLGIASRFPAVGERADEDSERGGIANIVQILEGNEHRQSEVEEEMSRSDSPPLKEIFIPANHTFKFGFLQDPVWKSAKPMKLEKSSRVRTKSDNDSRIQNIIRRGKDKFMQRMWNRKKMEANE